MTDIAIDLQEIEAATMSNLKDFQRATVNRIDELFRSGQHRILISDEVGLGKTLIARGTVAKTAVLRREEGDKLVKVVYICSNQAIAAQNLNKLQISDKITKESTHNSRLSMQHLKIFMQEHDADILNGFIQLIPLTPDTSFRMTAGTGMVTERALMYAILRRIEELAPFVSDLEIAMEDYANFAWDSWARDQQENFVMECEAKTEGKYLTYMIPEVTKQLHTNKLLEETIDLCKRIAANNKKRVDHTEVIGKLRMAFAQISVDLLNPDLVIMDEFQRFKYLIDSDSETETGMLARRFFSNNNVRMLLLSATPYKLYSTLEEINENMIDEHYSEFFKVMGFLIQEQDKRKKFKEVWNNYSIKLRELTLNDMTIIEAKNNAEDAMFGNVCRTERISAARSADILDDSSVKTPLKVSERDIESYIQASELLEEIAPNQSLPVDYIKSCPYLLSFMRDYQMKRSVEKHFTKNPGDIRKANRNCLWLSRNIIDNYDEIDAGNARLELIQNHAFANSAELLLWVPPSKPYYEPAGVFKDTNHFSKMLVFSSWEMVPRMIASMLSYEAERRTVGKLAIEGRKRNERDARYYPASGKRYPPARLNFSISDGNPKAMSLFCLIYPSEFLTSCFNPIDTLNRHLKIAELECVIKDKISEKLAKFAFQDETQGRVDDRWYYMAPLLMDTENYVNNWLNSGTSLATYEDEDSESAERGQKGFSTHLEQLIQLWRDKNRELGKMPDDLLDVLTNMAIASPAVCAYRVYKNIEIEAGTENIEYDVVQTIVRPSQIAKVFLNRMNTTESTAVIEVYYNKSSDDAHWKNLLSYCKEGNLQAVFDEYAHILIDSNGLSHSRHKNEGLHNLIIESMNARTVSYTIDTFNSFKNRIEGVKSRNTTSIRTHFAVAFTKGEGNADKDSDRKKVVRNSFNSPFRPFVLATTSIGQEGLDFHYYCRKIVHWNLPSNPIDLEQREGRINRFKCHAIRQNVAARYSDINYSQDIWTEMFDQAHKVEKNESSSDLIPYWCLSDSEDMIKIERIVPMYPLSRDISSYKRLIEILSLYRLTLGQARQEELLEYIFKNCDDREELKNLFINLSPFYRKKQSQQKGEISAETGIATAGLAAIPIPELVSSEESN